MMMLMIMKMMIDNDDDDAAQVTRECRKRLAWGNLRSGVIFFLFFFCFFASLAREGERHKGLIGRGHDLRLGMG